MQSWYYHYRGCSLFELINSAPKHLTKNQIKQLANSSRVTARNICDDLCKNKTIKGKL